MATAAYLCEILYCRVLHSKLSQRLLNDASSKTDKNNNSRISEYHLITSYTSLYDADASQQVASITEVYNKSVVPDNFEFINCLLILVVMYFKEDHG